MHKTPCTPSVATPSKSHQQWLPRVSDNTRICPGLMPRQFVAPEIHNCISSPGFLLFCWTWIQGDHNSMQLLSSLREVWWFQSNGPDGTDRQSEPQTDIATFRLNLGADSMKTHYPSVVFQAVTDKNISATDPNCSIFHIAGQYEHQGEKKKCWSHPHSSVRQAGLQKPW